MTGIIDSFGESAAIGDTFEIGDFNAIEPANRGTVTGTQILGKSGPSSLERMHRFQNHVPVTAARSIREGHDFFVNGLCRALDLANKAFTVIMSRSESGRLYNMGIQHTMHFKCPSNGYYYIALSPN